MHFNLLIFPVFPVLGSDVIYSEEAVMDLLDTLMQLCGFQTTIFLAGELRNGKNFPSPSHPLSQWFENLSCLMMGQKHLGYLGHNGSTFWLRLDKFELLGVPDFLCLPALVVTEQLLMLVSVADTVLEYFLEAAMKVFVIGRVEQTQWHPDYCSSRVVLYVLTKKWVQPVNIHMWRYPVVIYAHLCGEFRCTIGSRILLCYWQLVFRAKQRYL